MNDLWLNIGKRLERYKREWEYKSFHDAMEGKELLTKATTNKTIGIDYQKTTYYCTMEPQQTLVW